MGENGEIFSVAEVNFSLVEKRAADDVVRRRGIHRVKSQRAQHIPGRRGALVVHAGIGEAGRIAAVKPVQNLADQRLGFPRLAAPVIIISGLLVRLIALTILADQAGDIAGDAFWMIRRGKKFIELRAEFFPSAQQIDQALNIVRHEPERLPAAGLLHHEIVIRLQRIKR